MKVLKITAAVFVMLVTASPGHAFVAGGGRDAAKGNDCLIVLDGVEDADVTVKRNTNVITCTDCDPACDLDGLTDPDGSCLFDLSVCLNQGGIAGCDPAILKVAKASKKAVNAGLAVPAAPADASAICGPFAPISVSTRKNGRRAGKLKVKLLAKNGERPRRKDKDVFVFVCEPRPEGEACPAPGTTSTTTTTTSTTLILPTGVLPIVFTTTTTLILPTGVLPIVFTTTSTSSTLILPTGVLPIVFTTTTTLILPTGVLPGGF